MTHMLMGLAGGKVALMLEVIFVYFLKRLTGRAATTSNLSQIAQRLVLRRCLATLLLGSTDLNSCLKMLSKSLIKLFTSSHPTGNALEREVFSLGNHLKRALAFLYEVGLSIHFEKG